MKKTYFIYYVEGYDSDDIFTDKNIVKIEVHAISEEDAVRKATMSIKRKHYKVFGCYERLYVNNS